MSRCRRKKKAGVGSPGAVTHAGTHANSKAPVIGHSEVSFGAENSVGTRANKGQPKISTLSPPVESTLACQGGDRGHQRHVNPINRNFLKLLIGRMHDTAVPRGVAEIPVSLVGSQGPRRVGKLPVAFAEDFIYFFARRCYRMKYKDKYDD